MIVINSSGWLEFFADGPYAAATMRKTLVVDLSDEIALTAADLSLAHKVPMADAIILATGRAPWSRRVDHRF